MVLSPFLIISYFFVDRRFKFNFDFRAKTPMGYPDIKLQTSGQRQRVVSFEEAASRGGRLF